MSKKNILITGGDLDAFAAAWVLSEDPRFSVSVLSAYARPEALPWLSGAVRLAGDSPALRAMLDYFDVPYSENRARTLGTKASGAPITAYKQAAAVRWPEILGAWLVKAGERPDDFADPITGRMPARFPGVYEGPSLRFDALALAQGLYEFTSPELGRMVEDNPADGDVCVQSLENPGEYRCLECDILIHDRHRGRMAHVISVAGSGRSDFDTLCPSHTDAITRVGYRDGCYVAEALADWPRETVMADLAKLFGVDPPILGWDIRPSMSASDPSTLAGCIGDIVHTASATEF